MTFDEFMHSNTNWPIAQDELDLWASRSFKEQMQDVYGEAARLIKFKQEQSDKTSKQWDVFEKFCWMTHRSPKTTKGERDSLRFAEWEIYDYIFGENLFRNSDKSVMRWFNQWMYDVNYKVLAQG